MTLPAFDTLAYTKKLKDAGFTDQQAEGEARALNEIFESQAVTKQDLKDIETKIKDLDTKVETKIKDLDTKIETKISELKTLISESKSSLLMWIVPILVGQFALIFTKILH